MLQSTAQRALPGAVALAVLVFVLPLVDVSVSVAFFLVSAYVFAIVPITLLIHGSMIASEASTTPRLLACGAGAAVVGFLSALVANPGSLGGETGFLLLVALYVADLARIVAAACVGISLARHVTSVGTVLLIVIAAIAADVFSVFAGPTEALVREESPLLDLLLLVFPTFGSPLGFALGLSDFIFLALFSAAARFLDLRGTATLLAVCSAALLAVTTGLILNRPLPALPFIALAFVLANADLIPNRLNARR